MPASWDEACERCAGVGSKVKSIKRGRKGMVITYDLKTDCPDCAGTGKK